jgi:hypothetical protein
MFKGLIERLKYSFQKAFMLFPPKRKPVQCAPPLSRAKESAACRFFDALTAYMHDPSYDNHVEVYKAHLASKEAK